MVSTNFFLYFWWNSGYDLEKKRSGTCLYILPDCMLETLQFVNANVKHSITRGKIQLFVVGSVQIVSLLGTLFCIRFNLESFYLRNLFGDVVCSLVVLRFYFFLIITITNLLFLLMLSLLAFPDVGGFLLKLELLFLLMEDLNILSCRVMPHLIMV